MEIISWKYIEKVFEIESAKPNMLRLAPKLTKQHIELPAFSKMKVKRAAQIFSNTVQAAMMTYRPICSGHLPPEAYHTAAFVKNMDALFDIFNSTGLHDVKLYKRALQENSPSFEYLYMMRAILRYSFCRGRDILNIHLFITLSISVVETSYCIYLEAVTYVLQCVINIFL